MTYASTSKYVPSKDCINPWCRLTWYQENHERKWFWLFVWYCFKYAGQQYAPECNHPNPFYRPLCP